MREKSLAFVLEGGARGALTIARWRVIALVIGTLWAGSIILGYAYNFMLSAHPF